MGTHLEQRGCELLMPWPSAAASGVVGWRTTATASQRYHRGRCRIPALPSLYPSSGSAVLPPGWGRIACQRPRRLLDRPGRSLWRPLALAVVSLGVGNVWMSPSATARRSPAPSAPTFTSQQISDAKEMSARNTGSCARRPCEYHQLTRYSGTDWRLAVAPTPARRWV